MTDIIDTLWHRLDQFHDVETLEILEEAIMDRMIASSVDQRLPWADLLESCRAKMEAIYAGWRPWYNA